jgi:chromate reductase
LIARGVTRVFITVDKGVKMKKIAVLVGSLRKESFNRRMATALSLLASESLVLNIIEIGQLPLYNQDDDDNPPLVYTQFRQQIKSYDGVLFVTPEYNRSIPAVLKNAIDVGSRPYGQSVWDGKPAGVISVSPGAMGGFGANHHLRQTLVFLNMPCLQQPEAYIGNATNLFDGDGKLSNDKTAELMQKFIITFEEWVHINGKKNSNHAA